MVPCHKWRKEIVLKYKKVYKCFVHYSKYLCNEVEYNKQNNLIKWFTITVTINFESLLKRDSGTGVSQRIDSKFEELQILGDLSKLRGSHDKIAHARKS